MTAKFPALFTDATRPTEDLAGVITRFVCAPASGDLTVNAEDCAFSPRQKQPVIESETSANAAAQRFKRISARNSFFTGGETSESRRGCHWSFRSRHIHDDAVKKFQERSQPANREPLV